jgi:hypothetical protein
MPKAAKSTKQRHTPLHVELDADASVHRFGRVTAPGKRKQKREAEEEQDESVSQAEMRAGTVPGFKLWPSGDCKRLQETAGDCRRLRDVGAP